MRYKKIYIPKKVKDEIKKRFDRENPKREVLFTHIDIHLGKKAIMVYHKGILLGNLYMDSNHYLVVPFHFNNVNGKRILDFDTEYELERKIKYIVESYS